MKGKKKKSARERVVGCQTGVEAPRPSLPLCPAPSPPLPHLPHPPLSLAEGESTWARDGVETRRNTAHTDGG